MTKERFSWSSLSEARGELYGFSIIWIMLFHCYHGQIESFTHTAPFHWLGTLIQYGNMGCEVFILMSGISLYFSYHRNPDIKLFYLKRMKRLLLPVIIIWWPFWTYLYLVHKMKLVNLLRSFSFFRLFIDGNGNIWFVTMLIICYLAYPLLYHLLCKDRKKGGIILLILLCVSFVGNRVLRQYNPEYYEYIEILLHRLPSFFIGCWLGPWVFEKKESSGWLIPIAFMVVLIGFSAVHHGHMIEITRRTVYIPTGLAFTMLMAWLFTTFRQKHISAFLRFFGKISLECYLAHMMLIKVYDRQLFFYRNVPNSRLRYLGVLAAATLLAWAVNFVLSLPGRRKKKTT